MYLMRILHKKDIDLTWKKDIKEKTARVLLILALTKTSGTKKFSEYSGYIDTHVNVNIQKNYGCI